jgi:hypothetical protein
MTAKKEKVVPIEASSKAALHQAVKDVLDEASTPTQAKSKAIAALLASIEKGSLDDLKEACKLLGWTGKDQEYPRQKHINLH